MFRFIKINVDILHTDVHVDEAKKTKCYAVFLFSCQTGPAFLFPPKSLLKTFLLQNLHFGVMLVKVKNERI